jgi:hypothetical protein
VKCALNFLAGRPGVSDRRRRDHGSVGSQSHTRELIIPTAPSTVQRELPGFF